MSADIPTADVSGDGFDRDRSRAADRPGDARCLGIGGRARTGLAQPLVCELGSVPVGDREDRLAWVLAVGLTAFLLGEVVPR